jgi:drug/metabolite transporter (DMT)-like permease
MTPTHHMTRGMNRGTVAAVVFITLVWGLNWPMMKFSLREITPLYFRAITMTGGVLLLMAWLKLRGTPIAMSRPQWRAVAWLALPNVLGWHLFSILGVQALASGRAATLGFTMPIWTLLLGALFFGQRFTWRGIVAALCAGAAVALLVADEFTALAGRPVGIAWMQVAAVCWAMGTLMLRRTVLPLPTDVITTWMMALSSIAFWVLAVALEPVPSLSFSGPMWGALAWGVVINYALAQIMWFALARKLPPQASTFALMAVPLVGAMSAGFIVDEPVRTTDLIAAGFVMAAIASALWPAKPASPQSRA